jgi:2-methylfumaryl-CoA isomerase
LYDILSGMRVVEASSFVAAPSCGLHLLQWGAEVIRIDTVKGSPDAKRWPLASNGASLFWEGLNKGKKSVVIDLERPEGREIAVQLITAPGEEAGLFVTNHPAESFLSHAGLALLRPDLITVRVMGWADGRNAVDYTVNCIVGFPDLTGPIDGEPVNHVLPAWDLLAGTYAAFALLSVERKRQHTRQGAEVRIPLGELAIATLGNLGQIADVTITGRDRERTGNELYGALGRDFITADGERVMVVALTSRQWTALVRSLDISSEIGKLEMELGTSFARDEGTRFIHRQRLWKLIEPAIGSCSYRALTRRFDEAGVCWGPYLTLTRALHEDSRFSESNPLLTQTIHPSGFKYLTPGSPAFIQDTARGQPRRAPKLGEHTDEVLSNVLGFSQPHISRLHDQGIVRGASIG